MQVACIQQELGLIAKLAESSPLVILSMRRIELTRCFAKRRCRAPAVGRNDVHRSLHRRHNTLIHVPHVAPSVVIDRQSRFQVHNLIDQWPYERL